MARRDAARYAAMSDPECNRWFRCAWVPLPLEHKNPGVGAPGRRTFGDNTRTRSNTAAINTQALAEQCSARQA